MPLFIKFTQSTFCVLKIKSLCDKIHSNRKDEYYEKHYAENLYVYARPLW